MTSERAAALTDNGESMLVDPSSPVNDVVQQYPDTLPVFEAYNMDTCCRGNMTVESAARDAGVDPLIIAAELTAVIQRVRKPDVLPLDQTRVSARSCGCN